MSSAAWTETVGCVNTVSKSIGNCQEHTAPPPLCPAGGKGKVDISYWASEGGWERNCSVFLAAFLSARDGTCARVDVSGWVEKERGAIPPLLRQKAQMAGPPRFWGGVRRHTRWSAVPSHGVHFSPPSIRDGGPGRGVGGALITRSARRPAPTHLWPATFAPHCMQSYKVGGMLKREGAKEPSFQ